MWRRKNVVYRMLAVEAMMRSLAKAFGEDEDRWGLVGLLHDIDYEKTESAPEKHGLLAEDILTGVIPDEMIRIMKSHNFRHTYVMPEGRMEKALISCDAILGLLVASALVMPSKKLVDVKVESVGKRFKDKGFARGADRERILFCEQIGVPREVLRDCIRRTERISAEDWTMKQAV
jgi:putative nucleotidyltransferase with HDIG domain